MLQWAEVCNLFLIYRPEMWVLLTNLWVNLASLQNSGEKRSPYTGVSGLMIQKTFYHWERNHTTHHHHPHHHHPAFIISGWSHIVLPSSNDFYYLSVHITLSKKPWCRKPLWVLLVEFLPVSIEDQIPLLSVVPMCNRLHWLVCQELIAKLRQLRYDFLYILSTGLIRVGMGERGRLMKYIL